MPVGWMPRFSPDGTRRTWVRDGYYRAQFLTETLEIADNGVHLVVGGQPIAAPSCNELGAGGGVWAACRTDPVRVFTSTGLLVPGAGSPAVNPNGQIAYVDDRQADVKNLVFDGRVIARGGITDVRCSRTALVWRDNGRTWGARLDIGTLGLLFHTAAPQEIQVAPEEFGPVPIDTPIGPWVLCYTQTGIILRPFGESLGYRFDNGGQTYYPDAVYRDGGILAIFTNDRGEQSTQPFDLHAPRVPLDRQPGPVVNVPAIGRPLWCGWFVFGTASDLPANCILPVDARMQVLNDAGRAIVQYVAALHDSDLDELDAAIVDAQRRRLDPHLPILAYWTATAQQVRLPAGADVIGVEAYRHVEESLTVFEARVRAAVARCGHAWLIAQGYTSNATNDSDLGALVPVYARIARDCPNVDGLLVFSAGTRATGWADHPEVHDAWRQLVAGIPGTPARPPVEDPGSPPRLPPPPDHLPPHHPGPPASPFVTVHAFRIEGAMQTERGGLRGPQGKYLRVIPGTQGQGMWPDSFKLACDQDGSGDEAEWEATQLEGDEAGRFTLKNIRTGQFWGGDAGKFSTDPCHQYYTAPSVRGALEKPYGVTLPTGQKILFCVHDEGNVTAPLTWVKA